MKRFPDQSLLPETAIASFAMHGFVLLLMILPALLHFRLHAPPPENPPATLQIEYVNQAAQQKGAPPAATANPTAPATPQLASKPAPATPPAPPVAADVPVPPQSPPSPAAQAAQPPAPAPAAQEVPTVNLGDSDENRDQLLVTGDNVVSSGPDAHYRNMAPNYPRDAARHHQHGTVAMLIHVMPDGTAGYVEMVASSGVDSLDNAARDAVAKWHFTPAEQNGVKVASVYPMNIRFRDGDN